MMQASPFWDARLFRRFQDKLGGKVRFIISGGAPLALKVEEYLSTVLCCPVLQVGHPTCCHISLMVCYCRYHSHFPHVISCCTSRLLIIITILIMIICTMIRRNTEYNDIMKMSVPSACTIGLFMQCLKPRNSFDCDNTQSSRGCLLVSPSLSFSRTPCLLPQTGASLVQMLSISSPPPPPPPPPPIYPSNAPLK